MAGKHQEGCDDLAKKVSISWRRHLDSHRIRCRICPVYLLLHPPPWLPCDPPDLVVSHGRFFADFDEIAQIAAQPLEIARALYLRSIRSL